MCNDILKSNDRLKRCYCTSVEYSLTYLSFASFNAPPKVKVSRNDLERRSGKRIIAGTAFRLEFLVGWYYDADATVAVPELY